MHHLLVCTGAQAGREPGRPAVAAVRRRRPGGPWQVRAPPGWRCRWHAGRDGSPGARQDGRRRPPGPIQVGGVAARLPNPLPGPARAAIGAASPRAAPHQPYLLQAPPPSSTFLSQPSLLVHPECEAFPQRAPRLEAGPCMRDLTQHEAPISLLWPQRIAQISAGEHPRALPGVVGSATRPSAARSPLGCLPRIPEVLRQHRLARPSPAPARGQQGRALPLRNPPVAGAGAPRGGPTGKGRCSPGPAIARCKRWRAPRAPALP